MKKKYTQKRKQSKQYLRQMIPPWINGDISGITYQQKIQSKNGTVWANCVCMNGRTTVHSQLGFPDGSVIKNLPANRGDAGQKDPLEEEMATHSSILARRIPWIGELSGLQSLGSQGVDVTE